MIQDTSLLSWIELQPSLGKRQAEVYHALQALGNASDKELARHLNWSINRVTPRRGELLRKDLIEFAYVTFRNGAHEMTWQIKKRW